MIISFAKLFMVVAAAVMLAVFCKSLPEAGIWKYVRYTPEAAGVVYVLTIVIGAFTGLGFPDPPKDK